VIFPDAGFSTGTFTGGFSLPGSTWRGWVAKFVAFVLDPMDSSCRTGCE